MPIVELPNGQEIEFPEGMTANDISRVMFRYSQPGQILHKMFNPETLEPYRQAAGEMALDVMPVTGHKRGYDRIKDMMSRFNERSTIGKVLSGADMALEGAGLAADVVPALKAVGTGVAAGASLIPMMARGSDALSPMQKALRKQLGIIGGPLAKTADLDSLKAAQGMKAAGTDADDIFKQTGWWLDHPDGVPRFEIDDSIARTIGVDEPKVTRGRIYQSPDVLEHTNLYEAYPTAQRIQVGGSPERGLEGSYNPMDDAITNKTSRDANPERFKSVQLHELQHAIQSREGMARGGSPSLFPNIDHIFAALNKQYDLIDSKFANRLKAAEGDVKSLIKLRKDFPDEYAEINRLMSNYEVSSVDDLKEAIDKQWFTVEKTLLPSSQYRRLAGEAEARLAQDRMNLTPAERAARPFYKEFDVPLDEQIVRMEDGTMQSLPMDEASRMARGLLD